MASKTDKKGGTVPYGLRAPTALVKQVRTECDTKRLSLSDLVHRILDEYVQSEPIGIDLTVREFALPADTVRRLQRLHQAGAPKKDEFNAYLAALNAAGWTFHAMSEALGVSRQAVAQRARDANPDDVKSLPAVPVRSEFVRSKKTYAVDEMTAFSVRVDPELRSAARDRVQREGASLTTVLNRGLERFVSGDLTWPDLEPHDDDE